MQARMGMLHALTGAIVESVQGPSGLQWQAIDSVLSKALQTGSSFDVVDEVVYVGVRSRSGDMRLARSRVFVADYGTSRSIRSNTDHIRSQSLSDTI
jgi:hypothetical protein